MKETSQKFLNNNYAGIKKKEYPKWPGWKIIKEYKEAGTHPKEIVDERLDALVDGFYLLDYIIQEYVSDVSGIRDIKSLK